MGQNRFVVLMVAVFPDGVLIVCAATVILFLLRESRTTLLCHKSLLPQTCTDPKVAALKTPSHLENDPSERFYINMRDKIKQRIIKTMIKE